jgi:hypothetical protein
VDGDHYLISKKFEEIKNMMRGYYKGDGGGFP